MRVPSFALLFAALASSVLAGGGGRNDPPPSPTPSPPSASKLPTNVNIMTFNLRYSSASDGENNWSNRRNILYDTIRNNAPDFVGSQEGLNGQLNEISSAVSMPYIGVGRDNGNTKGEYSAIFYNPQLWYPESQETFWFCENPSDAGCKAWGATNARICTWGVFRSYRDGRRVRIFNAHLDNASELSRTNSIRILLSRIPAADGIPTFVTGDFNAGEWQPEANAMRNAGWVDTFRQINPNAGNVNTFHQFTGNTNGGKIDFIWSRPVDKTVTFAAKIERYNVNNRYPSDHFPVTATVKLP